MEKFERRKENGGGESICSVMSFHSDRSIIYEVKSVCRCLCVCMHFGLVHVTNHSLPLLLHIEVQKAETKKQNIKGMPNNLSAKQ